MLIQCDCDSRAFAPNGVWPLNRNPSHGSVSRDSPRVSCHVTSLSGRPVPLLRPVDVDCGILLASTAVAVTILDKSVKGDACEADLKERLCWFYRCQFPSLMENAAIHKRSPTWGHQPGAAELGCQAQHHAVCIFSWFCSTWVGWQDRVPR